MGDAELSQNPLVAGQQGTDPRTVLVLDGRDTLVSHLFQFVKKSGAVRSGETLRYATHCVGGVARDPAVGDDPDPAGIPDPMDVPLSVPVGYLPEGSSRRVVEREIASGHGGRGVPRASDALCRSFDQEASLMELGTRAPSRSGAECRCQIRAEGRGGTEAGRPRDAGGHA